MDIATVLEIIKMIDAGYDNLNRLKYSEEGCNVTDDYIEGGMHQLSALSDHLQSFIEGQLNAAENSTEQ